MKTNSLYTAASLLNLIVFTLLICFLPDQVPVRVDSSFVVDAMGSPWWIVSLPAGAAALSIALWLSTVNVKKSRNLIKIILVCIGAVLICLGWVFFSTAASGGDLGDRIGFPLATAVVLPLAEAVALVGGFRLEAPYRSVFAVAAHREEERAVGSINRFSGIAYLICGTVSAVGAVLFSFYVGDWLAFVLFATLFAIATGACLLFAKTVKS